MAFLYPLFLAGAVAIAVPIALHLLRRDAAPEVQFSAVRLLHRAPVERAERRRLRDLLLLAARVAALLLLAAAFARPYVQGGAAAPVRVVAIDRSYSMGAPGVFAKALEAAREAIDEAGRGERIAVIAFDDSLEVLATPGTAAAARTALERLEASFAATRYAPVFQQAVDVAEGAAGTLVLITDLQRAGWDGQAPPAALPSTWTLSVKDVVTAGPASPANVAVTGVAAGGDRVVATIRNSGGMARSGRVAVLHDGREVATGSYAAPPGAAVEVVMPWRVASSGALTVEIDDAEGLPADNRRLAMLGAGSATTALVVADVADASTSRNRSGWYLSRALATAFSGVEVAAASRLTAMSPEELSNQQGIALLTTKGLERVARQRLMAFVEGGGGLFIAASPDLDPAVLGEMTGWPALLSIDEQAGPLTLAATDVRHPIFRPFGALAANLGQARFARAWRVPPEGWSVAARFSNGTPALLERQPSSGRGRVLLLASDVDRRWNDFPLHPAFVPFAIEALRYIQGSRREAKEYTVAQAPAESGHKPGVYRGPNGRPYAVNVDVREGALDRLAADEFQALVERSPQAGSRAVERQAQQTESRQSYWQYGLLLMIATLVAESVVGRA